jgi:hypothetical protein
MIFNLLGSPALTNPGSLRTYTDLLVLINAVRSADYATSTAYWQSALMRDNRIDDRISSHPEFPASGQKLRNLWDY